MIGQSEDAKPKLSDSEKNYITNINKAFGPLLVALNDEEPKVRYMAAWAVGRFHDERAIEPLIKALKDKTKEVKLSAIHSLAYFEDERVFEALKNMLDDKNSEISQAATSALKNLEMLKSFPRNGR